MQVESRRFIVITPDRAVTSGFDNVEGAEAAALAFGNDAHVIDTASRPYQPAVQVVEDSSLNYVGHGSFDKRQGFDKNLIEAVKRDVWAAVLGFLARGASADAADASGGTALIWAVARNSPVIVDILLNAGADVNKADQGGMTPMKIAIEKGRNEISLRLKAAGAV
ncbi:MAG: ankyrin repeat domain-containing protein [Rhodospirillaceae bacterium]|nr:ankyrin repeat domain-containing protein [Rhodospirillaceae bacterium]